MAITGKDIKEIPIKEDLTKEAYVYVMDEGVFVRTPSVNICNNPSINFSVEDGVLYATYKEESNDQLES